VAIRRRARIVDRDGVVGRLHHVDIDERERPIAKVRVSPGKDVAVPFEVLEHDDGGGYRLPGRWRDYTLRAEDGTTSIPVIEERATVQVRPAPERRLRIRRRVVSEPKVVETPIWHEHLEVDRVPVDRFVDRMPEPRQEGDLLIIPVVEEVAVVERRLRVREELHVRIVRERLIHRETVELRRHELDITSDDDAPIHTTRHKGESS
jgi:stress response protein YsnF